MSTSDLNWESLIKNLKFKYFSLKNVICNNSWQLPQSAAYQRQTIGHMQTAEHKFLIEEESGVCQKEF